MRGNELKMTTNTAASKENAVVVLPTTKSSKELLFEQFDNVLKMGDDISISKTFERMMTLANNAMFETQNDIERSKYRCMVIMINKLKDTYICDDTGEINIGIDWFMNFSENILFSDKPFRDLPFASVVNTCRYIDKEVVNETRNRNKDVTLKWDNVEYAIASTVPVNYRPMYYLLINRSVMKTDIIHITNANGHHSFIKEFIRALTEVYESADSINVDLYNLHCKNRRIDKIFSEVSTALIRDSAIGRLVEYRSFASKFIRLSKIESFEQFISSSTVHQVMNALYDLYSIIKDIDIITGSKYVSKPIKVNYKDELVNYLVGFGNANTMLFKKILSLLLVEEI